MPVTVITGQSNICVTYRFNFPDGTTFKVAAVPLDTRTATRVLGNVTDEYSLVVPLSPPGVAFPFLANFKPRPSFVTLHTGLTGDALDLLTALLPELTTIPPADILVDIAQEWWTAQRGG